MTDFRQIQQIAYPESKRYVGVVMVVGIREEAEETYEEADEEEECNLMPFILHYPSPQSFRLGINNVCNLCLGSVIQA